MKKKKDINVHSWRERFLSDDSVIKERVNKYNGQYHLQEASDLELDERIELIERAIGLVEEAQQMVDQAVSSTGEERRYEAYGKYGFSQLLGNDNPYDTSLSDIIENFLKEEE